MNHKYLIIAIAVLAILPALAITQGESFSKMFPLQTQYIEWNIKTPTNAQIAYLSASCPIRYKVWYDFTASSQVDVTVIGEEKLKQLYRAGTPPSITPKQTLTRGPIKITFEFGTSMPIKAGTPLAVFITIQDKGTGLYPTIPSGKLSLSWDKTGFTTVQCDDKIDKTTLTNNQDIQMIKKVSPQIRCTFTAPSETDMKTYYLKVDLSGKYILDYTQTITVQPVMTK